jgi:hypothetical protein
MLTRLILYDNQKADLESSALLLSLPVTRQAALAIAMAQRPPIQHHLPVLRLQQSLNRPSPMFIRSFSPFRLPAVLFFPDSTRLSSSRTPPW